MSTLYHFTTSAHLPRIIRDGELRVPSYTSGNGHRDFIWTTTEAAGERTATGLSKLAAPKYRSGELTLVRLTLDGDGFEPWRDAVMRHGWTPDLIAKYERATPNRQSMASWYVRADNLPLTHVLAADTRTYLGHRWEPFDITHAVIKEATGGPAGADCLGIEIGGKMYWSERTLRPDGHDSYRFGMSSRAA